MENVSTFFEIAKKKFFYAFCHPSLSCLLVTPPCRFDRILPINYAVIMKKGKTATGVDARSYEAFVAKLNERIPDELLVEQIERELHAGGEAPDLKQMAIRQKARQDIEAHKGYRRKESHDAHPAGGLVVRVVKFSREASNDGKKTDAL